MSFRMSARISPFVASFLLLAVSSCGGGGGDGTGTLTIGVTDAPVDGAVAVVVEFTGVEMQHAGGGREIFDFNPPMTIDLLALQGGVRVTLLDGVEVPAGNYSWIRLDVNAESGVTDSFIEFPGMVVESLYIPSGNQNGLQLSSGFTVAQGSVTDFTIDFDLRKSVHDPLGQPDYFLRPSLRMVDNLEVGSISGTVDGSLITDPSCDNGSEHDIGNAVYVWTGAGATTGDVGSANEPLASGAVTFDEANDVYVYTVAFLLEGEYTIAFTCQAMNDSPAAGGDPIAFVGTTNKSVIAGQDTPHTF